MTRTTEKTAVWRIGLALVALALVAGACGDDDDTTTASGPDGPSAQPDDDGAADAGEEILVTGVDYEFRGLPETVAVGTQLALTNISEEEVHEIVLLKVADDETRPLNELLALPEDERNAVAAFRGVTVAFPGEDAGFTDGSMSLTEPGRYVLICSIPTGADPQAYRDAVADPDAEGPPNVEGGPPHLVNGMAAEIEVTA